MPYVRLSEAAFQSRLSDAGIRWDAVVSSRPDLEPAVRLQRQLIGLVIDLATTLEQAPLPRLSLPPKYLAAKLTRTVPALAREPISLPVEKFGQVALRLCDALAEGGAGDAATHIRSTLEAGRLDSGSLLRASLSRDQDGIRKGAIERGLAPDLLWLVAELAVSPFAHLLQHRLFASGDDALAAALEAWNSGYCPACGSWPALAEVVSGHRLLRCSFCAAAWELNQYTCVHCGEGGESFVTAAPDEDRKDRRLELCGACGTYLKAVELPEASPFPLLAIADLETMDLDVAAMENHYARPPLKHF